MRNLPRLPPAPVVRMFILALFGVIACVWALVRYYTRAHLPMLEPAPSAAPSEIPIETE